MASERKDERSEELKFTLATDEVLELLVGGRIYENPRLVAVRELLQNAVDACRLRRAVDPAAPAAISLSYGLGPDGRHRLSISDTGAGMSEAIARGYFLTIGRSYYSSPDFRARYGDLDFAPIARFGVGILASFLVADQAEVTSRHHDGPGEPIALCIDGLLSRVAARRPGPATAVGTTITLRLRPGIGYADLWPVVRHWARHVEAPITVDDGRVRRTLPPDDGAGFEGALLDPAHVTFVDSARAQQVKTRRVRLHGDGLRGFIEYAYRQTPGRLAGLGDREARGIVRFARDRLPRSLSLDGIAVGPELPAFAGDGGAALAFDLDLDSRRTGLQLRLDRRHFTHDAAYRRLVERLDAVLIDDIIELVQEQDLTPVQFARSLADLIDVRSLAAHAAKTGSDVPWQRLSALPVFALRQGGERQYLTGAAFVAQARVVRVRVGSERVHWPGWPPELTENFWFDRQAALCRRLGAAAALVATQDLSELTEALLARHYRPDTLVVDELLGSTYLVYAAGSAGEAAAPRTLPFAGPDGAPERRFLLSYWDAWVLNAHHPIVAARQALAPDDPRGPQVDKLLADLMLALGTLPDAAAAAQAAAVARAAADLLGCAAAAAGEEAAALPRHDLQDYWVGQWDRFLLQRAYGPGA